MENRPSPTESIDAVDVDAKIATSSPPPPTDDHEVERRQRRFAVLSYEQVKRLDAVMNQAVPIHGRGNFPTLDVKLKDLVAVVRARLEADGIRVRDIRVNGGAASHILAREGTRHTSSYNDLDLIFGVDLSTSKNFERVKTAVLESLLDFLPEGANRKRISGCSLKEAYVRKMVKVTNGDSTGDRWSLITLGNNNNNGGGASCSATRSRNVELKFVDTMRRQFEFSVDSFQIVLDTLLVFYECATMPMADDFYPTVVGESVHGDFEESLQHLHEKLIATRNPEEIRGGGLLKYCHLLVRGYRAVCPDRIKSLERYMCSRFFIDFSDLGQQQQKLENYLANHFGLYDGGGDGDLEEQDVSVDEEQDDGGNSDDDLFENGNNDLYSDEDDRTSTTTTSTTTTTTKKDDQRSRRYLTYDYLMTLYRVVDESTVCLMSHERRQTLGLIEELACQVYFHEQQRMFQRYFERQQRRRQRNSTSAATVDYLPPQPPLQFGQQRMSPWHHQCATIYGNSTIYYAPYAPTTGHHNQHHQHHHQQQQQHYHQQQHHHHQQQQQQQQQQHHQHHQHHHQHHHHQQQHQQHYTFSWLPCA